MKNGNEDNKEELNEPDYDEDGQDLDEFNCCYYYCFITIKL